MIFLHVFKLLYLLLYFRYYVLFYQSCGCISHPSSAPPELMGDQSGSFGTCPVALGWSVGMVAELGVHLLAEGQTPLPPPDQRVPEQKKAADSFLALLTQDAHESSSFPS